MSNNFQITAPEENNTDWRKMNATVSVFGVSRTSLSIVLWMLGRGCRETGYFGERPTVELNIRAEAVMARLGVTVVPAYDITWGQEWATPHKDGR